VTKTRKIEWILGSVEEQHGNPKKEDEKLTEGDSNSRAGQSGENHGPHQEEKQWKWRKRVQSVGKEKKKTKREK